MQITRRREIVRVADEYRSKLKAIRYGILDLFSECEQQGYKLLRYPMGEDSILGFVQKRDEDVIICTNSSVRLSREIFTLAHEIGHAVLHLDKTYAFSDTDITMGNATADEKEQEANLFAAYMLMPDDLTRKYVDLELNKTGETMDAFDIAKIMSEFNVSFETVLNRLVDTKVITTAKRTLLDSEKNEYRVGKLLYSTGGDAALNIPAKCVRIPFEYLDYTIAVYNRGVISEDILNKVLAFYNLTADDIEEKLNKDEETDDIDWEVSDSEWEAILGGIED